MSDQSGEPKCHCTMDVSEYCPFHGHIQFATRQGPRNPSSEAGLLREPKSQEQVEAMNNAEAPDIEEMKRDLLGGGGVPGFAGTIWTDLRECQRVDWGSYGAEYPCTKSTGHDGPHQCIDKDDCPHTWWERGVTQEEQRKYYKKQERADVCPECILGPPNWSERKDGHCSHCNDTGKRGAARDAAKEPGDGK